MRHPQNEIPLRRSPNLVLISAALLLSSSSCNWCVPVDGFSSIQSATHPLGSHDVTATRRLDLATTRTNRHLWALQASLDDSDEGDDEDDDSWSRAGKESPFGVRRRVKKVLERARNRTGIRNNSEDGVPEPPIRPLRTEQTATNIVAESASIGGLGAVVVDASGTVDVALELAPRNGKSNANYANGAVQRPASTPSPRASRPEDEFIMAPARNGVQKKSSEEVDAIKSDVPAALKAPPVPLPFSLPTLTPDQKRLLEAGERIQEQSKMGREGSGYVVLDVHAPPYVVWECLLDFESYPQTIPTVREVTMLTSANLKAGYHAEKPVVPGTGRELRHCGKPSVTRAAFTLSKFRLNIAAIHKYRPHPAGDYMVFTLDPQCTNLVLRNAKGVWHTQANPDGRGEEYTRVWLLCEVEVSSLLPKFIVEYAANRAMPRATTWLKPQVEAAASLWLKNNPNGSTKYNSNDL